MSEKFFSIILPVYNAEKYLKECIESVIKQSCQSWEFIIIDDGSIDGSVNIYNTYTYDDRIKIFCQNNLGVSNARNVGLSVAKGKYILFLDADDLLEENALEILYNDIDGSVVDLISYDYTLQLGHKYIPARKSNKCGDYIGIEKINKIITFSVRQSQWYEEEYYGNFRSVWSKCFNRDLIIRNSLMFKEGLKYGEDMVFVLSCLVNAQYVKIINHKFYIYRDNINSVMHTRKWTSSGQGVLYFYAVENIVGNKVEESDLRDLWLETAESDWMLISSGKLSFNNKYLTFRRLIQSDLYKRFSSVFNTKYSSKKQHIYCLCIRHHMVISLMFLSYIREKLHRYRKRVFEKKILYKDKNNE